MLLCTTAAIVLVALLPVCHPSEVDEGLIGDLLHGYDRNGAGTLSLPRTNPAYSLTVRFGLSLISLDTSSCDDLMIAKLWLRLGWKDPHLAWDPKEHGGITRIRLPINKIWTPDMKLFNSYDTTMDVDESTLAMVTNDGGVLWIPPARTRTKCRHNAETGVWNCKLKFGSWTYDADALHLAWYHSEKAMEVDYFDKWDYEIISNTAELITRHYPCCDEPYQDMTYHLAFKKL